MRTIIDLIGLSLVATGAVVWGIGFRLCSEETQRKFAAKIAQVIHDYR